MRHNPLDQFGKSSFGQTPENGGQSPTSESTPRAMPLGHTIASATAQDVATPPANEVHPGMIHTLIETSRRWLRTGWVATGSGITVGLLTSLLLIAGLIDLVIVLWPSFRFLALMVVLIPTSLAFGWGVLRPLVRRITNRAVARRIEHQLPGIHNRLVSCVDLESTAQTPAISNSFYRRLLTEAIARIRDFHPKRLLDRDHLKRSAIFAGSGLLAFVVVLQIFSDRLPTALARILSPFADIPPASGVVYRVDPGDHKVLRGDEVMFTVTVEKGIPEELEIVLEVLEGKEKGKSLKFDLVSQSDSIWTFRLPGFESSFDYRVIGGGTWSKLYRVKMLDRPRIAELKTRLTYPSYMGAIPPEEGLPDVADVAGPIDSQVEIMVQVEGDPTVGQIELLEPRVKSVPIVNRPERNWIEKQAPQGATAEGTWEWVPDLDGRLAHHHPTAAGLTNHQFLNAPIGFRVKPGEVLYADVYLDAEVPPEAVMLQFHDGQNWEHRAYWGADVITVGQPDTVSRFSAGPLPEKGRWVRLEIPASLLDLEGRTLHGISFAQFGGSCWWSKSGTIPPAEKKVDELVVIETIPMQNLGAVKTPSTTANVTNKETAGNQADSSTSSSSTPRKSRQLWSGQFPLKRDGWYRVEFRNELGNPNPRMKEGKLTAIPDLPPQVVVERPGTDLVLSAPQKVPVSISAFDDFGLADIVLSVQIGEAGGFRGRPVKHYESLQKADSAIVVLDLVEEKLKLGDVLKYRVEARDRKGQSAQSQDYTIRINQDPQAADQVLANLEKNEETFREQLEKLIADQENIQKEIEQLEARHEPLAQKLEAAEKAAQKAAEEAAKQQAKENPQAANNPPAPQPPQLDEETKKELDEVKAEIAKLNQLEQQNVQAAQQLENSIKNIAQELERQQLVAPELQEEMKRVAESFHDLAVEPLSDLNAMLQENAKPEETNPALEELAEQGEQVAENLEALKERMDAIAQAQQESKSDIQAAMENFQRELTRQNAKLTSQELNDLKEKIAELREAMKDLLKDQEQLMEFTPNVPDLLVEDLADKQEQLDEEIDDSLADAKQLLDTEEYRKLEQQRKADSQERPDMSEEGTADDPQDAADPEPDNAEGEPADDSDAAENVADNKNAAAEEPLFRPALGGPKPKPDPRFAEKQPAKKPNANEKADAQKQKANDPAADLQAVADAQNQNSTDDDASASEQMREELGQQQRQQARALSEAEQSLASDEATIDELLNELDEQLAEIHEAVDMPAEDLAATDDQADAKSEVQELPLNELLPRLTPEQARQLAEMLQSEQMQKAMAMSARGKQKQQDDQQDPNNTPPPAGQPQPSENPVGNLLGTLNGKPLIQIELLKLDPATRQAILNMQPAQREEILQGLREEGPEGYREYIRDYFERLTKVKTQQQK